MTDQETQAQEVTTTESPPPSLTLQDLILVAQVIQVSSQRGTFRAEELAEVGNLYNKVVLFLQASGALAPAPTAPAPTEES